MRWIWLIVVTPFVLAGFWCVLVYGALRGKGIRRAELPPRLRDCISPSPCSASDVSELYNELLYAVAQKFPGESRHETALRYIREREQSTGEAGSCKQNS